MMETLLHIQQGDTWMEEILWTDSQNQPIDLTGAKARMQMRPVVSSGTIILELTSENGRIILDPAGKISLLVSAVDTAALAAEGGVYDLEVELASSVVTKVIRGKYEITPEVTR